MGGQELERAASSVVRAALPRRVLVAEHDPVDASRLVALLGRLGIEGGRIRVADSLLGARAALAREQFDCVLLDLALPDAPGLEGVSVLCSAVPNVPIVVMPADGQESLVYAAMAEGADEYVPKPGLAPSELTDVLLRALQRRRGRARSRAQMERAASALDSIPAPTVALDGSGRIVATNSAWTDAAVAAGADLAAVGVGVSYLTVCDMAVGQGCEPAAEVAAGIREVLSGLRAQFSLDYPSATPDGARWFTARVSPAGALGGGAVVTHLDITEVRLAEQALQGPELPSPDSLDPAAPIFALLSPEGTVRYLSDAAIRLLGLSVTDPWSPRTLDWLRPDDRDQLIRRLQQARAEPGRREQMIVRVRDSGGRWLALDLTVVNRLDDPAVGAFAVTGADVTEGQRLRITRNLESRLLRRLPSAVVIIDDGGTVVYWNARAADIFGYPPEEVVGRSISDLDLFPPDSTDRQAIRRELRSRRRWDGELDGRRRDGSPVPLHVTLEAVEDPETGFRGVIGMSADISDRRSLENRLGREAHLDPLTGLPNRLALVEHVESALERAGGRSTSVALLFVDIDDFKSINDSMGHEAGNEVIRSVAELFAAVLEPGDLLARLGGDEFVICREGITADEAVELGKRILRLLSVPFKLGSQSMTLSATMGVAVSTPGAPMEKLLQEADVAMYEAKEAGKGRVQLFDAALRYQRRRTRDIATHLKAALGTDQIVTYFQPVVAIGTGRVLGFEALVRWQHPARGFITPDRFVPVAEETGLIEPLGAQVLDDACRALVAWSAERPRLTMAVNASARQLHSLDFVDVVRDALGRHGLDPSRLCIEVTESAVADVQTAAEALTQLRSLGVSIAMDDFGTGHSSFSRLLSLPLDRLKVDRSFVEAMLDDAGSRAVVTAVIGLARAMGLQVIAEGVEKPAQADALLGLGCEMAQGFLWSRPLPFTGAAALLAQAL